MTMSHFFRASMSKASLRVFSFFAWAGALPPALEVEKNTGSMRVKSPSACMRSMRTEPTMPRQPTRPTSGCCPFESFISYRLSKVIQSFVPGSSGRGRGATNRSLLALGNRLFGDGGHDGVAHFAGADFLRSIGVNVRRAQPGGEHVLHGR